MRELGAPHETTGREADLPKVREGWIKDVQIARWRMERACRRRVIIWELGACRG